MDPQQQQLIERVKQAQNILVAVNSNPSVDQLSAAIGLTLVLNKLDKHGTAVFSGEVPSTLEFLKPEDTLEKNTDSLRDFIIALDKSKADKLRYKVEDQVVRIFITPYKTSLSENDLEFSQGDFNVDVVVCLGVNNQEDLDTAITAHGRILHDATVVSVSTEGQGNLGSINWVDPSASSLSEMVVSLADALDKKALDSQIATALLTGIVASTERFRNDKTSPKTMSASAELMGAGANQQLIATELETAPEQPLVTTDAATGSDGAAPDQPGPREEQKKPEPGTLEIDHEGEEEHADTEAPGDEAPEEPHPQVQVDENGQLSSRNDEPEEPQISGVRGVANDGTPTEGGTTEVKHDRVTEPPRVDEGDLTANTEPEALDPPTEELTLPPLSDEPLLSHDANPLPSSTVPGLQPAPADWQAPAVPPVTSDETLTEIEQSVGSPHLQAQPAETPVASGPSASSNIPPALSTGSVDSARSVVEAAYSGSTASADPLAPIAALNAQPLGSELHDQAAAQPTPPTPPAAPVSNPVPNTGFNEPTPGTSPADETLDMPLPTNAFTPPSGSSEQFQNPQAFPPSTFPGTPQPGNSQSAGPNGAPPVPPPFVPPPPLQ